MTAPPKSATYRKAIVTFIDVLGFRSLIETRPPEDIATIVRLLYFAGDAHEPEKRNAQGGLHVVAFSDSIVRTRDLEHLPGALFWELLALVHLQAGLADNGVFIRGGMTFGPIYAKGTTVFGPALVRAYELESKHAKHPRIVVGPELLAAFEREEFRDMNDHATESAHVDALLYRDHDYPSVDYLRAIESELAEPAAYVRFMKKHGSTIASHFDRTADDGVRAKAIWLAGYHNRVVEGLDAGRLADLHASPDDVRVHDVPVRFHP